MPKTEAKTNETQGSVAAFLAGVKDESRRRDCKVVSAIMKSATKSPPKMWGPSIVGFGRYHYVYASGREGDSPLVAFSPRKRDLTLYITPGFEKRAALVKKLGTIKTGTSCVYLRSLDDIDLPALKILIREAVAFTKRRYG